MSKEYKEKARWLEEVIDTNINSFNKKKVNSKRKDLTAKLLITIFSLSTTVLLAINLFENRYFLKIVSLVLVFAIAIINSLDLFFHFRKSYVYYTTTTNKLYGLRDDLNFYLAGKQNEINSSAKLEDFKIRLDHILEEVNTKWANIR